MTTGTCFYFDAKTCKRKPDMDRDVTAHYAESASRDWPTEIVEWRSSATPHDVRWFKAGRQVLTWDGAKHTAG
jgi:hypothetical protein